MGGAGHFNSFQKKAFSISLGKLHIFLFRKLKYIGKLRKAERDLLEAPKRNSFNLNLGNKPISWILKNSDNHKDRNCFLDFHLQ